MGVLVGLCVGVAEITVVAVGVGGAIVGVGSGAGDTEEVAAGVVSGRGVDVGETGELSTTGVSVKLITVEIPAGVVAAGSGASVSGSSPFWHATITINRNESATRR